MYRTFFIALVFAALVFAALAPAQSPDTVLIVMNQASPLSHKIAEYYAERRHVPAGNICRLNASTNEEVSRSEYDDQVARPIQDYLQGHKLAEKVLYIVTTGGVPLKIRGSLGLAAEAASVDSELALLYSDMHGHPHSTPGGVPNPFFGKTSVTFRHPDFPIYLVTRLAGFDFDDVKAMIDRAEVAHNRGKVVIDLKGHDNTQGNRWLLDAARQVPRDRLVVDLTSSVLMHQDDVIAYASWGSNDPDRKERHLGFHWLPGAIATEYVSTNARTFARPPENWNIGAWGDAKSTFAGSPQTLTADFIHDGATGASGHVYEPYLQYNPRPNLVLPAYLHGRNLAESFYVGIPVLSWMNIVVGDPLCTLAAP
ncbi:MAG TPA: TIGR03790 family protein [Bryobacteraceae bacterium]|nr:TIGR03790 family protein [Bryobacteraceae bacterium]